MDELLKEYRAQLLETEQKAQAAFDKTLLSLSGGALGVSFAFVRQFVGEGVASKPDFLFAAWICWIASLAAVLLSHYFSTLAIRKAIKQVDVGSIAVQRPGGHFDTAVAAFNGAGGLLFIAGLVLIAFFVRANLG